MDDKKICIIRCVNNEQYALEQDFYFSRLIVPEGYTLDILSVTDASSMCSGYNEAMMASDAKYKIYMHQDVFLFKADFLKKMLEIFSDTKIGMIGLVGTKKLDTTCVPWFSERRGNIVIGFPEKVDDPEKLMDFAGDYDEVSVIDGLLMATQVDIPWREDLFKGWDMYDTSQCFEMRRAGYKVVVPKQEKPWALHDEDNINTKNYIGELKLFRNEYKKEIIDDETPVNTTPLDVLFLLPEGGTEDIPRALANCGYKVEMPYFRFKPNNKKIEKEYIFLNSYYSRRDIKVVISAIFIPAAARFCHEKNIPYISYIYDSPQQALFYPESKYPTNYFYIFDKEFCKIAERQGCKNVSYMPCAAVPEYKETIIISETDKNKFACDISFVGQLYNGDEFMEMFENLPQNEKKPLEDYYHDNKLNWSKKRPWPKMPKELCERLGKSVVSETMTDELFYGTAVMSRKLAQIERIEVLNYLAKDFDVHLYTGSDTSKLVGVNVHSKVDYYTDAKKVFALSKINLNITLPSIETGVPWRVFDIMGMGGFVLTNYQEEVDELFEIDKEIVVFKNLKELKEKVEYYLSHEEERKIIAENGYKKVCRDYNLKDTVKKMMVD